MNKVVLFIDDDVDVREAFADLLAFHGWTVAHAGDGQDALDWLAGHPPPDAILLDLKMPRCDGYQFRAAQLADRRWRDIRTVVFTGDAGRAASGGTCLPSLEGAPVVSKSVDFADLAELLNG